MDASTYRVPNLQFDLLVVDCHQSRTEFDSDRQIVDWLEPLVSELQQQAALAHAGVTNDDVFEKICVAHVVSCPYLLLFWLFRVRLSLKVCTIAVKQNLIVDVNRAPQLLCFFNRFQRSNFSLKYTT